VKDRKLQYMTQIGEVSPADALQQTHKEINRMGRFAAENLYLAVNCFFDYDEQKAAAVAETEETVNFLEHAILTKLVDLRTPDMNHQDLEQVYCMTRVVSDIERLSDYAENIVEYATTLHGGKASISQEAMKELHSMAELALQSVELSLKIFKKKSHTRFKEAEALEEQVDQTREKLIQNHIKRLMDSNCEPRGGVVFNDMVSDLERCSDHAINIAASVGDAPF